MVCTSAVGEKVPLAIIGQSANPKCFRLGKPPCYYNNQANSWFDKVITRWWLNTVFAPYCRRCFGNQKVLLLLDNFRAHDVGAECIPPNVIVFFLPPNLTATHQPADQGIISRLKLGYKSKLLASLLSICDDPCKYEAAVELGKTRVAGCRGIECADKPHVLDAMKIVVEVTTTIQTVLL